MYHWDFLAALQNADLLLQGIGITILLTTCSIILALSHRRGYGTSNGFRPETCRVCCDLLHGAVPVAAIASADLLGVFGIADRIRLDVSLRSYRA